MNTTLRVATAVALLALVGCGPVPDHTVVTGDWGDEASSISGYQTYGPLPADSDLSSGPRASLYFDADWAERTSGTIYASSELWIAAHQDRFPRCGTTGQVFAGVRVGHDDPMVVELYDGMPGETRYGGLTLPAHARSVEIWLWSDRGDGCVEWDSDYGRNYHFDVHAWNPARVVFGDDWSERVEGELEAGGVLVVDYDWDRLPQCRIIYRGWPTWEILAHVRFDQGGDPWAQTVTRPGGQGDYSVYPVLAVFEIPEQARHVELWFENTQYPPTCQAWDSDYGRNYHFDIAP